MQAAGVLERLLRAGGLAGRFKDYVAHFRLVYASGVDGADTLDAAALFEAGKDFLFDTKLLIAKVRDGSYTGTVSSFPGITLAQVDTLEKAGSDLVEWFERTGFCSTNLDQTEADQRTLAD